MGESKPGSYMEGENFIHELAVGGQSALLFTLFGIYEWLLIG